MEAVQYDIVIDRGSDWSKVLELLDANDVAIPLATVFFKGEISDPNAAVPGAAATFEFAFVSGGTTGRVVVTLTLEEGLKLKRNKFYTYDIFARFGDEEEDDWDRLIFGEVDLRYNTTPIIPFTPA